MISTLTHAEWNDIVARSSGGSFLQSWEWGEMQHVLGVPYWRLSAGQAELSVGESTTPQALGLVIQRPLLWNRSWVYLPRGPVINDNAPATAWSVLQQEIEKVAKQNHALFVRADPPWQETQAKVLLHSAWRKSEREVQPRHTLVVDLTKPADTLLSEMHSKTRYNIRVAEKHNVSIHFREDEQALEEFLKLTQEVEARSDFHYHPAAYYRAMREALVPSHMFTVAFAEAEGKVLAAHLLISFAGTVTYAHGASSSHKRDYMAPHLLQWQSMKWAAGRKATQYDFFGVAPSDAPVNHPWAGITRFKTGFGGKRVDYCGAYDLVQDQAWYAAFTVTRRLRKLVR